MQGHEKRKKLKELLSLNRTRREVIRFNPGGIVNGEYFGEEERASTTEDGIQIENVKNVYLMDCGCIDSPNKIVALCDICGKRAVCANCLVKCTECGSRGCRYCVKPNNEGGKIGLCDECRSKLKMLEGVQRVSSGMLRFFVKREG